MQSTYRYDVQTGYAADAWTEYIFDDNIVSKILDVTIKDNNADLQWLNNAVDGYGDTFVVFSDDPPLQLPHAARQFRIKNHTAGLIAWFQVAPYQ